MELRLFPRGAAAELSILDNSAFRDFKQDFAKLYDPVKDVEEKSNILKRVWDAFPRHRFIGYWRQCGYTDNTKEETTKQKKTVNQPKIQAFFK